MRDSDVKRFSNLMKAMSETYGSEIPSKEKAELYFRVLCDFDIDTVENAVYGLLRTRTITSTFPVPGEIIEQISGGNTAAMIALDKAEKAAAQYGSYRSVQFDDPVIHMAIESMGGWPKFCRPDDDQEWHWHQKEFIRLYEAFSKQNRSCMKYLPGIHERDNNANGMPYNEKLCIIGEGMQSKKWSRISSTENSQLPKIPFSPKELV